jgi:hypothetical protein
MTADGSQPGGLPPGPPPGNNFGSGGTEGAGGAPDTPATAQQGNNVGDNGKPEAGAAPTKLPLKPKSRSQEHNVTRQRQAFKSSGIYDRDRWDREMAKDIYEANLKTATYAGMEAAKLLGSTYDPEKTLAYLQRNAELAASEFNSATQASVEGSKNIDLTFDQVQLRAAKSDKTREAIMLAWGENEAIRQSTQGEHQ